MEKNNYIGVRLTEDERRIVDCVCAEFDITPSRFIRLAIQHTQRLNIDATDLETSDGFRRFVNRDKNRLLFCHK